MREEKNKPPNCNTNSIRGDLQTDTTEVRNVRDGGGDGRLGDSRGCSWAVRALRSELGRRAIRTAAEKGTTHLRCIARHVDSYK